MIHPIQALLRTFNPYENPDADPEQARQGRLLVYVAAILGGCGVAYGGVYVALGMTLPALGCSSFLVTSTALLFWFRRSGDTVRAGHGVGMAAAFALVLITLGSGGLYSPAMPWMILAPMLVTLIAGRRGGLGWLAFATAWFSLLYGLDGTGIVPPSSVPDWFLPVFAMLCPAGLVLALFGMAWSYEVARDDALGRVRAASAEAARARDAAERAHEEARLVLDQVDQGLVVVAPDGDLASARSAALDRWLGVSEDPAGKVWDLFAGTAPEVATWLELGWEELADGFLPHALVLDQLPKRAVIAGRHLALAYRALGDEEALEGVMVVITDETEMVAVREKEAAQREKLGVLSRMLEAPQAVLDFIEEARQLVRAVEQGADPVLERRWIHTLKGNGGVFGLERFAAALHEVEDELAGHDEAATAAQRARVVEAWRAVEAMLEPVLARTATGTLMVEETELDRVIGDLEGGVAPRAVAAAMRRWRWRSVTEGLEQLAERTRALARRVGKGVEVAVRGEGWRHPDQPAWKTFWSASIHVLRNALDHGLEAEEERLARQKPPQGRVELCARQTDLHWVVEMADDGAGIDWEAVRSAAGLDEAAGLEDLRDALFRDGVTTRREATELSGRGVGMAAVREAVDELDGHVEVETEPGQGTVIRFLVPRADVPPSRFPRRVA